MQFTSKYSSPLGEIILTSDEKGLTGLFFTNQKHFYFDNKWIEKETKFTSDAKRWLDIYFKGMKPNFKVPLHFLGTDFQKEVWSIIYTIPYGKTMTYGEIAELIAKRRKIKRMSSQAVGNAVSMNKISLIVPCHRVIGANGNLVGYAGGLDKKTKLLELESRFYEKNNYNNNNTNIRFNDNRIL